MALVTKKNLKNCGCSPKQVKNFSTKFGINGDVFVLYDNKVQTGVVRQIDCTFKDGDPELETTILYTLELSELKKTIQLPEELCFGSKEDEGEFVSVSEKDCHMRKLI